VRDLRDHYLPSVWRFVYGNVHGDCHLAEDIVSETVLALIKAAAAPEFEMQNPGGWLRTVASNKIADHFRAAARRQQLVDETENISQTFSDEDAGGQHDRHERRMEVRDVMDELSDQQRMALEWKYVDRLSVRDIAERLDASEKAAESILFRARNEFRHRMQLRDFEQGSGADWSDPTSSQLGRLNSDDPDVDDSTSGAQNSSSSFRLPRVTHRPSS